MAQILVIDDEAPLRKNLVRFLRMEGHEVSEAIDGQEGFAMAQEQHPDLIFCDVMMPHMNGMQVLAALQDDAKLRSIPLIFVSASAEPERLEEAIGLGARGYLAKPFSFDQLRKILDIHLAGGELQGKI